ncbi:MAG: acetyl-CoA carboxylase biotin carboxyl carrier protein [Pseudomonadota bacterium]|nr:acetyl-CoA carboxylase biotin carboxyl carrier protein [Pseudomonadota bacterium]
MTEETPGRSAGMSIDGALVRELAQLLAETDLSEIEVEDGDRRIRVARVVAASAAPSVAPPPALAPALAPAPAPAAVAETAAPVAAGKPVKSPMVGTAYLGSDPATPPFVTVGQAVKIGDTLLIIEAMKVMNPITAPFAGTVTAVLIDNAQPVEYDQPLIVIG